MINKIQMSDVINKLKQIDYLTFFDMNKPIRIEYISVKQNKKYQLHKPFKVESILAVNFPPEITKSPTSFNRERLLKQQFGDIINTFATTVVAKLPNVNWTFLYNNLNSVTTSTKTYKFENIIYRINTLGKYNAGTNNIGLVFQKYKENIIHELFHMASSYFKSGNKTCYSGFCQRSVNSRCIGRGLNEGYTQFLTERYYGDKGIFLTYNYEKTIAGLLEKIIGKEKMENLYFSANLLGLIQELKKYQSSEEIMQFICCLDYLNANTIIPKNRDMLLLSQKNISKFLLNCYLKKEKAQYDAGLITFDVLIKRMSAYSSAIPRVAYINNKVILFYDSNELGKDITSVLGLNVIIEEKIEIPPDFNGKLKQKLMI